MKRIALLAAAFALAACADAPTGSEPIGIRPSLAATTSTTNEIVPFSDVVFVACANGGAGEDVALSGTLHILEHLTENGNNFSLKLHAQPQGVSGEGLTTGDKYQATGVTQERIGGSFQNGSFEDTFINNFRIIGQGPGNNFLIHQTIHVTVNANGVVTSEVENSTADCK